MSEPEIRPTERRSGDDGMTIVEMMIALTVVMIVFAGLAATLIASFNAIRSNEARVVATAIGNELIEEMSTVPWDLLGLYEDDVTDLGLPNDEFEGDPIVTIPEPGGARHPVVPEPDDDEFERDGRTYRVERYVTWHVEDVGPNLKRMIVIISWEVGGRQSSIRTEALRSPDPDDLSNLHVTINHIKNKGGGDVDGEDRVPLHPPGDSNEYKNVDAFEVTITVGITQANAQLSFRDRDGNTQILTTPSTGGGEHVRTFLIALNAYEFRHGNVTFTATATGPEGEFASHAAVLRFYQPVEVQELRFTQGGSPVTEVTVCDGELQGELVVEAEVFGLTPAEGAVQGALGLQWGRQPGSGQPLHDRMPNPPVEMSHTEATSSGADFIAVIEDGTPLITSVGEVANGFRLDGRRLLGTFDPGTGAYDEHPLDDNDSRRAVVIEEACP